MIKLPKPLATEGVWYPNGTDKPGVIGDCYTPEQMLQFRRDALEEAAMVCETTDIVTYTFDGLLFDSGAETLGKAIDAIHKLKETT